jgi:hypothetical protein
VPVRDLSLNYGHKYKPTCINAFRLAIVYDLALRARTKNKHGIHYAPRINVPPGKDISQPFALYK